jgi:hypothetical protein
MNKFSKKTAFGITVAASAALVVGFAAPAMASTSHNTPLGDSSTHSSSSSVTQAQLDALRTVTTGITGGDISTWTPLVVSPEVGVGDVASGNAVGSGNDIPLLSGNTVSAPVASGNETGIANNDANGSANGNGNGNATANGDSISSSVKDLVNNTTKDLGLGNITGNSATATPTTGASGSLGDVTGDLGLGNLLGGR